MLWTQCLRQSKQADCLNSHGWGRAKTSARNSILYSPHTRWQWYHRAHFPADSFCGGMLTTSSPSRSTPVPSTSYHSSKTDLGYLHQKPGSRSYLWQSCDNKEQREGPKKHSVQTTFQCTHWKKALEPKTLDSRKLHINSSRKHSGKLFLLNSQLKQKDK